MAKQYINPSVTVNSVDLSGYVASVDMPEETDAIETTAGGATYRTYIGGLKDAEVTLDFHNDYADALVYHTVKALIGTTTNVVIKPRSSATDTDNPEWTCVCLITEWNRISGSVGDLDEYSVTWPCNSITEALS